MASQRSRNARGATRSNGGSGEEHILWQQIQEDLRAIVDEVNTSNDNTRQLIAQDSYVARNAGTESSSSEVADVDAALSKLDTLLRGGVKITDSLLGKIKAVIDKVNILRAVQKGKEDADLSAIQQASASRERGTGAAGRTGSARLNNSREKDRERDRDTKDRDKDREREKDKKKDEDKDVYDFDAGGDSPAPSPPVGGGHTRRLGSGGGGAGSDRSARDSVPPRAGDRGDTPANSKADSAEPQPPPSASAAGGQGGTAAIQRSKVTFVKGQDVAFKTKASATEQSDWYLGRVLQVLGEGKSRRYKVRDEDPEVEEEKRTEYRTSASNMIPIPNAGTDLPPLEKGKTVLAMYPKTTTFYKAAVVSTDAETGSISLWFDGEESGDKIQEVERRYVLEYRA
jgi:SAGA-associated factor 29